MLSNVHDSMGIQNLILPLFGFFRDKIVIPMDVCDHVFYIYPFYEHITRQVSRITHKVLDKVCIRNLVLPNLDMCAKIVVSNEQ